MKADSSSVGVWTALIRDESGQILPVTAFMLIVLLGLAGLVLDVGHVYMCHRELQSSCDAAALAGATAMSGATQNPLATTMSGVQAIATKYSAVAGNKNVYRNLPNVAMVSGYPALKCLATFQAQGVSCVGYVPYNAVQVKQQAAVPLNFARLFGFSTMTIQASSTAVKGGGPSRPYNIAIVLDTTLSMQLYDADCGATQMACSLSGVQVLLQHLDPCGTSQPTCTVTAGNSANSVARVSLFTFPQLNYPTVGADSDCSNSAAMATNYTFPAALATSYAPGTTPGSTTYRVLDFQSDYRASDTAISLYASSLLTTAAGGSPGCAGMGTPTYAGYVGTYYAATMYAAQAALTQEQTAYPGSQNVMIILGDGDANAPHYNPPTGGPGSITVMASPADASGTYPSYMGECGQSIKAALDATNAGTTVYTVAYGSPSFGCSFDQDLAYFLIGKPNTSYVPNVQPCNEMAQMATHPWNFFSDYKQTGSGSTCVAAQTEVALSDIFLQIAGDLTEARLVSDGVS